MVDELYTELQTIMDMDEPIRFTNTYQGMPVSYEGKVVRISDNRAVFQVGRTQLVAMRNSRYTYLRSNLLHTTLKAKVIGMDWHKQLVELSDFVYSYETIGHRSLVRVQPANPLPAIITPMQTHEPIDADISEVSLGGLAITISRQGVEHADMKKDDQLQIEYMLPLQIIDVSKVRVGCEGLIKNITPESSGLRYRLGTQVFPDIDTEKLVIKYLAQRQADLLKEIRRLSADAPLV